MIIYSNGKEMKEGDICRILTKSNTIFSFLYIEKIEGNNVSVRSVSTSETLKLKKDSLEEIENGYMCNLSFIMRKEDYEKILDVFLKKELKDLDYEIDNKFLEEWKKC